MENPMNMLTIAFTRARRMREPEPLPDITETPREAFLAGWWGGICIGLVTGLSVGIVIAKYVWRLA